MAVSKERNEFLTAVGPGTPAGELFRRYWLPICPARELSAPKAKRRTRLLGEDLVLFRNGKGEFGLLPQRCPHRHVSLYFGFVEDDGLRCPYHGWKFAADGECIEMPFEPPETKLRARACLRAYPVEEMGGLLWTYMGPEPRPLLPRWEAAVRTDGVRSISVLPIHHCNWLQAQENSYDPVHVYYLHGRMIESQHLEDRFKTDVAYLYRPIEKFEFELVREPAWTGIRKIRTYGGDRPEREPGHPAVFPNILVNPQGNKLVMHFRVPVDDEHTSIIWLEFTPDENALAPAANHDEVEVTYLPHPLGPDGEYDLASFVGQDLMAWETQGPLYDRSEEILGSSDRGITMFRNLLREQIDLVAAGQDPAGVIRDPALNQTITFEVGHAIYDLYKQLETAR